MDLNNTSNKLALALSGGGFRASLFHIGVFASLADCGLLKDIEIISCVSGGSIIGAYYYLYLKKLLEEKNDTKIDKDDYIKMVRDMESGFITGVQKNIRVREYSNVFKNIRMIKENYSNSDRMAELYDDMFYNNFSNGTRIKMRELLINPKGENNFKIRENNKDRINKVPMLILNASTLNTGRNWQFTAVDMGERDPEEDSIDFDKNSIFKSFRFTDLNEEMYEKYRDFPLSVAVAASACVPAIFTPLSLTELYPNAVPLLVDGGVYDNQGLSAILYEKSTDIIISDACGQLKFSNRIGSDIPNVLSHTSSIQMNRIRNLDLESINLNKKAGNIDNYILMHLLEEADIKELFQGEKKFAQKTLDSKTSFGINREIHELLSNIRTDLDCFTEVEAYSLMYDAYKMSQFLLNNSELINKYQEKSETSAWVFMKIMDFIEGNIKSEDYKNQLKISSNIICKVVKLSPLQYINGIILTLISAIPLIIYYYIITNIMNYINIIIIILILIILFFIPWLVNSIFKRRVPFLNWLKLPLALIISPSVSIFNSLYLLIINPFYKRRGSLEHLIKISNK